MAMPAETQVHKDSLARARLGLMGLDLDRMIEVVRRGEEARANRTGFAPLTAPGYDAFSYRVEAFREFYCPDWTPKNLGGVDLTISPGGQIAVLTRAGNAHVGLDLPAATTQPQPCKDVGQTAEALIEQTGTLFDRHWLQPQGVLRPDFEVWMLLVHATDSVVRSELSFGAEASNKQIIHWFERIILPDLDPKNLVRRPSAEAPPEEFDIRVTRKRTG